MRATGEIHRFAVRRESAGSFIVLTVYLGFYLFRRLPFPFIVFSGDKDVTGLDSCDAAQFVACSLWACGSQVQHVHIIPCQHRAIVRTAGIE